MHVDFGAGSGELAYRLARSDPSTLVIATDAAPEALADISAKALAKPAKGGLPNFLCARLALAEAPGPLAGLAHSLTVHLPWGSLLAAVARPEQGRLAPLAAILQEPSHFEAVFGYSLAADRAQVLEHALPPLASERLAALRRYFESVEVLSLDELKAIPSAWAKKLAFSGKPRVFVRVRGLLHRDAPLC